MNMVSRFVAVIVLALMIVPAFSQPGVEGDRIVLPNGWSLTPAGTHVPLGDLPLNLVISHNRRLAAVTNNGQSTQTIDLVDLVTKKRTDSIVIAKSWYGLAFSSNDRYLYASGGHDNVVKRYNVQNNRLALKDSFVLGERWPNRIGTAGLDVDDKTSNQLFVVTREDSSLYIFDLATRKIKSKTSLGSEAYTCKLSPDRKKLYISVWGGGKLLVWDVAGQKITAAITTGNHPNEICISKNSKLLYVANANDNSVSVIHTAAIRLFFYFNQG